MDASQERVTRKLRPKSKEPYKAECAAMSPILDVQGTNPWKPLMREEFLGDEQRSFGVERAPGGSLDGAI